MANLQGQVLSRMYGTDKHALRSLQVERMHCGTTAGSSLGELQGTSLAAHS